MKKAREWKATPAQVEEYRRRKPSPLYPLYGYIKCDGIDCVVEILNQEDNKYEVHAPNGWHFVPDYLHTMLAVDLADLRERVSNNGLVECDDDCGGLEE